jgi:hypothetical protein
MKARDIIHTHAHTHSHTHTHINTKNVKVHHEWKQKRFLPRAEFTKLNLQRVLEESRIAFRVILKAKLNPAAAKITLLFFAAKSI